MSKTDAPKAWEHHLAERQVAIAQGTSPLANGGRGHVALHQKIAAQTIAETALLLKQVKAVGDLIATADVPTIEDPHSFPEESRCGMFRRIATWAEELGPERTTDGVAFAGDEPRGASENYLDNLSRS